MTSLSTQQDQYVKNLVQQANTKNAKIIDLMIPEMRRATDLYEFVVPWKSLNPRSVQIATEALKELTREYWPNIISSQRRSRVFADQHRAKTRSRTFEDNEIEPGSYDCKRKLDNLELLDHQYKRVSDIGWAAPETIVERFAESEVIFHELFKIYSELEQQCPDIIERTNKCFTRVQERRKNLFKIMNEYVSLGFKRRAMRE